MAYEMMPSVVMDVSVRRSIIVLRWALLFIFVVLVQGGVLEASTIALALSATFIGLYDVFHTWLEFAAPERVRLSTRVQFFTSHVDILTISAGLIALHDVRNPLWAIYFISLVSVASLLDRGGMNEYTLWTTANYVAFACITALLGHSVAWEYVLIVALLLVVVGWNATMLADGQQRLRAIITAAATTDQLTGLPNRRHFHQSYPTSLEEAIVKRVPLTLMLIDFDHFKEINDKQGHPAGDDKLREVATALAQAVRADDIVARYGGDEFIVVAPHTTREEGMVLAERLRHAAHACDASVSIGIAVFPEDADDETELIESADSALYLAKHAGRNCVRHAPLAA